jgi:hypothetical protein
MHDQFEAAELLEGMGGERRRTRSRSEVAVGTTCRDDGPPLGAQPLHDGGADAPGSACNERALVWSP